jgi:hypothetical protein
MPQGIIILFTTRDKFLFCISSVLGVAKFFVEASVAPLRFPLFHTNNRSCSLSMGADERTAIRSHWPLEALLEERR